MSNAKPKVVVVMPAYNAAKTLRMTYQELPHDVVDLVILVDDGSKDDTIKIARELGLEIFVHNRNYGYGANQKTCYREALRAGADIIVMVHPDYQYDPTLLPEIIAPILSNEADVVLGSRLLGGDVMKQGMPWWKFIANRFLTELEKVNVDMNSDAFVFDQEIMAQFVEARMRVAEVPVPTRYFPQASSASFLQSSRYGLSILWVLCRYVLHRTGIRRSLQFDSILGRYHNPAEGAEDPRT